MLTPPCTHHNAPESARESPESLSWLGPGLRLECAPERLEQAVVSTSQHEKVLVDPRPDGGGGAPEHAGELDFGFP